MKTVQEMPMVFDRVSTHEELHQVLALLSESAPSAAADTATETDQKKALRAATSDLWLDAAAEFDEEHEDHEYHEDEESDVQGELYRWAETVAGKSERIN